MIHEVDVALRSLIERDATDGAQVEVVFDAPTKEWSSRRNTPTIDVYLYDIREDLRRRERGLINEYQADGLITARRLPPRYFKLSYLVTAWTQRPEDEHRLLSTLLDCFLRYDAIPAEFLTGPLAELGLPVALTIGLPPPEDRSFADVWTALGGELKPSLDVVVSTPTDAGQRYLAGPPVDEPVTISLGGNGSWPPRENRRAPRGHRVPVGARGAAPGAPSARSGSGAASSEAASEETAQSASEFGAVTAPAPVRGLSWGELAGRPGSESAAAATDADATDSAPDDAAAKPAENARKPRRRGQSGLNQK